MAKRLKCNTCGATYPDTRDGSAPFYAHVCPDERIATHAACDEKGNTVKPAVFEAMPNPRNENLKRDPNDPRKHVITSEGSGFTVLE
jgi:hypothetical protein